MHQLLRYASELHVGIGFLLEKLLLQFRSPKNNTISRIDNATNISVALVFSISGHTSIPGVLQPAFRLSE
jgi:hypothetical protein